MDAFVSRSHTIEDAYLALSFYSITDVPANFASLIESLQLAHSSWLFQFTAEGQAKHCNEGSFLCKIFYWSCCESLQFDTHFAVKNPSRIW